MLVLTRKIGESFVIGDSITITVVSSKGGQVRVGIDAPKDLAITRSELGIGKRSESQVLLSKKPDTDPA